MKALVREGLIAGVFGGTAVAARFLLYDGGGKAAGGIAAWCWRNGDEDRRAVVS